MSVLLAGRYEIVELLGTGGEARVVKALDHRHERPVALKIRRVRDDQAREELLGEARVLFGLQPHPALPLVREDFFTDDGTEYVVVMDWVDGTDLARILAARGTPGLAPSSVVAYLAEAAEALAHLHRHDPPVIHGDVKPANLILTSGGHVKLVDFGLSSTPLAPGRRLGTPGFRAPELASGAPPSVSGDVFGLAATAFALLTGFPPEGVLPSWPGLDPALAQQLEAALRQGLSTNPARRPGTPGELVERLRAGWAATLPTGVTTFCLTDIVGSTELWARDPGVMAAVLVRHDELVAAAVEDHGGRFLKSKGEGDATFSVFASAPDAVLAAIAASRAIRDEPWPDGFDDLAVRIGVHTGEAAIRDSDYFGPAVNLAARVRGQAGAGEVLLSPLTAELTQAHLPPGCTLVDLGSHRLRGVEAPQRLHAVRAPGLATPPDAGHCPFRGLLAFGPEDRRFYFGREEAVETAVERLRRGRQLAVVGASGSGKSSLLRAGVVAAARAGDLPGVRRAVLIVPGAHPPGTIEGDVMTLVVVDQFEELYTVCKDAGARRRFIDALLAHPGPMALGVRADHYGDLSAHARLADVVAANHLLLGAMTDEELRRAVVEPARLAGLRLEPGLVDVVLAEVSGEPGALPLLSHALRATWERRDGRTLTIAAYRAGGGVSSALAQTADALVQSVSDVDRRVLRNIFVRLTELGDGVEDTRRRVAIAELVPDDGGEDEVRALLDRFADARLLTLHDGTADVAHEVLIREWPMLRRWLEEDREGLRLHRRLGDAARIWASSGRVATDLYRGTRLGAAVEWAQVHPDALNATERAFLDASIAAAEAERRSQARVNRRLRALLAVAGLLLVAAALTGVLALMAGEDARRSARRADAQRLGAQALLDDRLDRSLLLAQAGRTLEDSVATRGYLLSALVRHPGAIGAIQGEAFTSLALRSDGRLLAAGDPEGTVVLIDTRTRRRVGDPIHTDLAVSSLDFSPDGELLAVTGATAKFEGTAGRAALLAVATGQVVRDFPIGPYPGDPEQLPFLDARFGVDGRRLVVTMTAELPGPFPTYARHFDVSSGRPAGPARRIGTREGLVAPVATARRDRLVVSEAAGTYVVDARTLRVRRRLPAGASSVGLSPDGRSVALGARDGGVSVLDAASGRTRALAGRHEDAVSQLAFSADGRTLASTGADGRVIIWDLRRRDVRETLTGHSGLITSLRISDDGRTLFTAGQDGRIIVWDIAGDRRLAHPFAGGNALREQFPPALAISPDGARVLTGLRGGRVRLHDARTLRSPRTLPGIDGRIATAVEFSPDGRRYAVTGAGGSVEVRDARTGDRVRPTLPGMRTGVAPPGARPGREQTWDAQALAFSPDGSRLAVADLARNLRVLDLRSGRVVAGPLEDYALHLSFSPDGRRLAVGVDVRGVELRDAATLEVVADLRGAPGRDSDRWVRFSPDGRLLAVTSNGGYTRLWDVASQRPAGPPLAGHEGGVLSAEFSPDGRLLATAATDGSVILWDVASRRPVGTLPGRPGWTTARFSPDGRRLFTLRETGDAERWEIDPAAWSRHACRVAGRELTRAEWEEFVPGRDFRRVCPEAGAASAQP